MVHGKANILNITINMWPYKDKDLASYLISFFPPPMNIVFYFGEIQNKRKAYGAHPGDNYIKHILIILGIKKINKTL